jgi:hypothetical protein
MQNVYYRFRLDGYDRAKVNNSTFPHGLRTKDRSPSRTVLSCGASKLNTETGSPARPTIIVEKLTVKLDAQQLTGIYIC